EHHRTFRLQTGEVGDAPAVMRRRAGQAVDFSGRLPGHRAAPAIADDADFSRPLQRLYRGSDVLDRIIEAGLLHQAAADLDFRLGVAALVTALHAVEHRRRNHLITVGGVTVGHRTDVAVDTENLHDHHQA